MLAELLARVHDQLFLLIYVTTLFGLVVGGTIAGTLLKRWWLSRPWCSRCWFGRALPGDQFCLSCKLELY